MLTRKTPRNTAQEATDDPLDMLARLWGSGGPGAGIEEMEAQGQRELVIYTTPSRPNPTKADRYSDEVHDIRAKAEADAVEWLSEHYPNWRDHGAYWD